MFLVIKKRSFQLFMTMKIETYLKLIEFYFEFLNKKPIKEIRKRCFKLRL